MVETVFRQAAHLIIFDKHIALTGELADNFLTLRLSDIDSDRLLTAIGTKEIGGILRIITLLVLEVGRPPVACIVTGLGPFDFDHLGAEVGEHLTGPRASQNTAHIQYFVTLERSRHDC